MGEVCFQVLVHLNDFLAVLCAFVQAIGLEIGHQIQDVFWKQMYTKFKKSFQEHSRKSPKFKLSFWR